MRFKNTFILGLLILSTGAISAQQEKPNNLQVARMETVNKYLNALNNADAKVINSLFAPNGMVVSTSKGRIEHDKFFNAFLPALTSANVKVFTIYKSNDDHYAARFHFSWVEKNNDSGSGNYMDDFSFVKNSDKLESVFMFENKMEPN